MNYEAWLRVKSPVIGECELRGFVASKVNSKWEVWTTRFGCGLSHW